MSARTHLLPALMLLVGLALVARTLAAGGGATAAGLLLGVLLAAAGGLRLWAETRGRR
jgi:hypothetical protein